MNGGATAVHVFIGPTLTAAEATALVPGARTHPPVAHGDLIALDPAPGEVVVIIDGYYHQRAPVRHKEVLHLLDRGVRVVGCASMGALRAAELDVHGMVGHGRVYEMYRDGEIDADDEVAVVHVPGGSFEARNVPLVNVRHAAASAEAAGVITAEQAAAVVGAARSLHYTDRSWRMIGATAPDAGVDALVEFLRAHPEAADLKHRDAVTTLGALPEILAAPTEPVPLGHWENRHVYEWLADFAGSGTVHAPADDAVNDAVGDAEVLRYRQLYDAGFPALWRRFVVGEAARGPGVTSGPGDQVGVAREVMAGAGALDRALAADNPFLTPAERAGLDEPEALVRTLVRSYVPPRGLHDVLARLPRPADPDGIRAAVRAARALNDQVLWRRRVRLVERLSTDRLARHLEVLWDVPPGDEGALLAGARDRGFATVPDAVSAVRPYFLRDETRTSGSAAERWMRT